MRPLLSLMDRAPPGAADLLVFLATPQFVLRRRAAVADPKFALSRSPRILRETGRQYAELSVRLATARQITQGAPDCFSADEQYGAGLLGPGPGADRGALYGIGRIALYAPRGSPLAGRADERRSRQLLPASSALRHC
jgi:hypothetical protein